MRSTSISSIPINPSSIGENSRLGCDCEKDQGSVELWPTLTNFVRRNYVLLESNVDILPSYGWYIACSPHLVDMATKMPSTHSEADRNWQWPEKTWFQERLNTIKAREQEQRRKPAMNSVKPPLDVQSSSLPTEPLKVD